MLNNTPFKLLNDEFAAFTVRFVRSALPEKASSPMLVTLAGMMMLVSPEQSSKVPS